MTPKILLVNPAIYDFAAYDFWLRPYGLLSVAGYLRGKADFKFFDYLDRLNPFIAHQQGLESDEWGRGRFYCEQIPTPPCLSHVPRHFRRFGLPRKMFEQFLQRQGPFDFALVQTMMTYWYHGVREVIDDIRKLCPKTKIILGGNYVTLCAAHAQTLGADFLAHGVNLEPLYEYLALGPDVCQPALWNAYENLKVGVLKLSDGCPFKCTYCSVPNIYRKFNARPFERAIAELDLLSELGAEHIVFYDDALLFEPDKVIVPFLQQLLKRGIKLNFHTPNGLNARFLTEALAELMVRAGFRTFYLGFESASHNWQQRTGAKVRRDELARAVRCLTAAGADPAKITAYQILGHPDIATQQLEQSMRFANGLGIRGMLADFSPIPGTPDGRRCGRWVDMNEPLMHNKTAFPIILLGFDETNRLKDLQRKLNRSLR